VQNVVKALVRSGALPPRPIFMPLIFAASAKIGGMTPQQFYSNPTKIANGLRQLQGPLRCDALVCYADQTLVAEALGATVGWEAGTPQIVAPPAEIIPAEIAGRGRVPIMLEVVRRLRVVLQDRVALAVAVPGSLATARYLSTASTAAEGPSPADYLAVAGGATLQAARLACEAGADLILLIEAELPAADNPVRPQWLAILETICNVTRFHEALPVLLAIHTAIGAWPEVAAQGALPCPQAQDMVPAAGTLPDGPYGIALPPSLTPLPASDRSLLKQHNRNCALVTTAGDLPYEIEPKEVRRLLATLRQIVTDW